MGKDKLAIFDFDNTLFRTKAFWSEGVFPIFQKEYGIPESSVRQVFRKSVSGKADYFTEEAFLSEMRTAFPALIAENINDLFRKSAFSSEARRFLSEGAFESVSDLRVRGYELLLLSYGDLDFKTRLFEILGIADAFNRASIAVINYPKKEYLNNLSFYDEIVIINDVVEETVQMAEVLKGKGIPFIYPIILSEKRESETLSAAAGLKTVSSLCEIAEINLS